MENFNDALLLLVERALAEDLGSGDHSTLSCIPPHKIGKAVLKIKEEGILAGMQVAAFIFQWLEPSARFTAFKKDGEPVQAGEIAFEVIGSIHTILKAERLVLNCMQRMSGIATLTNRYVKAIQGFDAKILDTRKTTPNFRLLEKEAVQIGGGVNHRFGLYDMIMLKDNHIDFCGGIEEAINRAYDYSLNLPKPVKIEVETRNLKDVETVCKIGTGKVFRIMLDNFSPATIKDAVALINKRFETEASGGIRLENISAYASTGVDYISVGGIIHQAQSIDLSLKAVLH